MSLREYLSTNFGQATSDNVYYVNSYGNSIVDIPNGPDSMASPATTIAPQKSDDVSSHPGHRLILDSLLVGPFIRRRALCGRP
jgi:hypothetical protein